MRVDVLTLFPAAFTGPLDVSIIGRAREAGLLTLALHDIREHALDRHRSVDDYPFGGGQGMVMRVDVLDRALDHVQALVARPGHVVYLSPQGQRLDDALVRDLAAEERLILVCGRYEGVDQRFVDHRVDREISIGDFVLTGGELPAMVLIDAVARHLPGALGDAASSEDESFADGLLEQPQYTRPAEYRGWEVPPVLLGGNHAAIERWKLEGRIERTRQRRPDLLTPDNAVLPPLRRPRGLRGVTTRAVGPSDLEPVARLWSAAGFPVAAAGPGSLAALGAALDAGTLFVVVAEVRGRLVAAALAGFDGQAGLVHRLVTDDAMRGAGAGSAVLAAVEGMLRERGCARILCPVPEGEFVGMAFLARRGWREDGRRLFVRDLSP